MYLYAKDAFWENKSYIQTIIIIIKIFKKSQPLLSFALCLEEDILVCFLSLSHILQVKMCLLSHFILSVIYPQMLWILFLLLELPESEALLDSFFVAICLD